jgi:hypothetical protein
MIINVRNSSGNIVQETVVRETKCYIYTLRYKYNKKTKMEVISSSLNIPGHLKRRIVD